MTDYRGGGGKIFSHDSVGSPELVTYEVGEKNKITCAQLTPRYIKVASDIFSMFKVEKIKSVSEIGIGYGGQCNVLMNIFDLDRYNLIDLPEVLSLTERCLNLIGMTEKIRYIDGTHLYHEVRSDFLISEFAFSELTRQVQNVYLKKVVLNSKAGYITWNDGIEKKVWNTDGYTLDEILSLIPKSKVVHLPPKMYQGDQETCTIVWGTK